MADTVWHVIAIHPFVPGIKTSAHRTKAGADERAAKHLGIILGDLLHDVDAFATLAHPTPSNWCEVLSEINKLWHLDPAFFDVSVVELELEP